jgi:phage tail-like protein
MALGKRKDPYLAFNFLVEITGLVVGGFTEVSGLQVETEVEEYREGGLNNYVHKLPGPSRYPSNLTLKHGLTDIDGLWKWHQEVVRGIINRKKISILLHDSTQKERWRWDFEGAFPVKWSGPELRAGSTDVAVESIEFVHKGMIKPSGKKPGLVEQIKNLMSG